MGFNNRRSFIKAGTRIHDWINDPNSAHRKCLRCGLRVDRATIKGVTTVVYTTKDGKKSDSFIECNG